MERMRSLDEIYQTIENNQLVLMIIKTNHCGVCDAVSAKVSSMLEPKTFVKGFTVYMEDVPELASIYLTFSAPTLLLFYAEKEVYRATRFIHFDELDHVLSQYEAAM